MHIVLCERASKPELFFFGHGSPAFSPGENDALHLFRDGELRFERGCGSLERRDAGGDMVVHFIFVEESHLFGDSSVDARVSRMEADYQHSFVIKGFHQGELFFESHVGGTSDGGSLFGIMGKFARNQAAGIEDEVGLFKHSLSSDGNQFRVARTCSYDFDMPVVAVAIGGERYGERKIAAFCQHALLFLNQ